MVRTRVLAIRNDLAGTAATPVYACPAGRTAIVRTWAAHSTNGTPGGVNVLVRRGSTPAVKLASYLGDAGASWLATGLYVVLEQGDELLVQATGSTTACRFYASGVLLVGNPS